VAGEVWTEVADKNTKKRVLSLHVTCKFIGVGWFALVPLSKNCDSFLICFFCFED
jgi:hypothetical protein